MSASGSLTSAVPALPERPLVFDDLHAPLYTVGQVAESVVQPARSAGGQRRYSRDEIDRIGAVSAMAGEGMTLPGIKRILVLEAEVAALQTTITQLRVQLAGD